MALCLHLVFRRAATLAPGDPCRNERKPLAQDSGRMGTNLQLLLEVLVRVDVAGRPLLMASCSIIEDVLAHPY